jgi:peptide/nickel transport system substrate-binding protein
MLFRIALLICLVAAIAGCGGPTQTGTNHVSEFREATQAEAVSFHPYLTTDSASSSYQGMVYSGGLMRRDEETLELIPNMAESWEVSEDGLTFVFHLRDDMLWSDEEPLTAFDFEWTFQQMMKPENEYPYRDWLDFIESYIAASAYKITIRIKEPFCSALEKMDSVTPLPRHIWKDLDWKDNSEVVHPTVASGPYKLVEWSREDHIIFEANDLYWKGRPKIDRYLIRVIPEQSIAYVMLESGEVDMATVLPSQYEEVKANENLKLYEWWLARGSWSYFGYNLRKDVMQDLEVRQAINYAIPKERIIETVMAGLARRMPSTLVPDSPYYNENVPWFHCDPNRARTMLDEMGYLVSEETEMREGFPELVIVYGPHNNKVRQQLAVILQSYLEAIGIRSEIQSFEWGAYLDYLKKNTMDWDMCILSWRATIDPDGLKQIWSSEFPDLNHVAYDNPEIEAMFERVSHDCENRAKIYDDIQWILANDCPYVFLFQNLSFAAVNKRVRGIKPTTLGIGYNMHEWYIEP